MLVSPFQYYPVAHFYATFSHIGIAQVYLPPMQNATVAVIKSSCLLVTTPILVVNRLMDTDLIYNTFALILYLCGVSVLNLFKSDFRVICHLRPSINEVYQNNVVGEYGKIDNHYQPSQKMICLPFR